MSEGTRKRSLRDNFPSAGHSGNAKMRKEDGHLIHEKKPFDSIDDVTLELRSIEDFVARGKGDAFQEILERLDETDILVRRKQGQDVAAEQRFLYIEELRKLLDEHVCKSARAEFESLLGKMEADDRLVRKQTNHRENANAESENMAIPPQQEPSQQEQQPSQVNAKSTVVIKEEVQVEESHPDIQNLPAGADGFSSSSPISEEPLELSNQLKKFTQISFNARLLNMLRTDSRKEANVTAFKELFSLIEQRTTLIKNAQYECTLGDQHNFHQELLAKLHSFKREVSVKMKGAFKKVVDMLQSDALGASQFNVPYFKYLSDFELLKYIVNNSDSAAAEHILRARNLRLKSISLESKGDVIELNLTESDLGASSAGVDHHTYRRLKYGTGVNKNGSAGALELFNIILKFYDVSQASITLTSERSTIWVIHQLLISTFGAPPVDEKAKIRVKDIIIESSEMTDFLQWFCPKSICILCDSRMCVNPPSLIDGVDVIDCSIHNVDLLMERCTAPMIRLKGTTTWTHDSIWRVLTAHRLSADNGVVRNITCRCYFRTLKCWRELFSSWSRSFEAAHGNTGRKVTLMDNNIDHVTLTLH